MAAYYPNVEQLKALASRTVESITVSHVGPYLAMRLPAWTDEGDTTTVDYVLQIDGVVRVSLGGTESVADPATGPDPVWLRFIGKTVDAASLVPPGGLRLMFRDGDVITVEGDARYEPWALHGSDATSIISAAGGRVEMLGPNSPAEGHII